MNCPKFSPAFFAQLETGNVLFFSRQWLLLVTHPTLAAAANQRGLYLSKKQSCKSEAEKPSYVVSCFPSFRIVRFYMFSRVSSKRGVYQPRWPFGGPSVMSSLRIFSLYISVLTFRGCFPGRLTHSTVTLFFVTHVVRVPYTLLLFVPKREDFSASSLFSRTPPLISLVTLLQLFISPAPNLKKSSFCLSSLLKLEASLLLPFLRKHQAPQWWHRTITSGHKP